MSYSQKSILLLSFVSESALIIIYLIWDIFRPLPDLGLPTLTDLGAGIVYSLPLFLLNFIFFGPWLADKPYMKRFRDFKNDIVLPLAKCLDWKAALVVAILAGVGEELFFRGLLVEETGIIISSLLFSVMHFFSAVKDFLVIAFIYFLFGIYFALVYQYTGGLWVPILAHAIYDFVVLIHLRYFEKTELADIKH